MQKVVKRKPYRNLQLVQMKFTGILRKQFKIPNEIVLYYVLKIVKGQVPYSGRKWRQRMMPIPHLTTNAALVISFVLRFDKSLTF